MPCGVFLCWSQENLRFDILPRLDSILEAQYHSNKTLDKQVWVCKYGCMDYTADTTKLREQLYEEITSLIEQEHSYNQIAKKLNITPQYVAYIKKKLEAKGGEE